MAERRKRSSHGDDTGFGFKIPSNWPKWKTQCSAHKRSSPEVQCSRWAVRGMPTCYRHGSGGVRNAQIGLIRYMAWVVTGCPKDTPPVYARFITIAAALEMLFNHGQGNATQRMRAALWLLDVDVPPAHNSVDTQALDVRSVLSAEEDSNAEASS